MADLSRRRFALAKQGGGEGGRTLWTLAGHGLANHPRYRLSHPPVWPQYYNGLLNLEQL